MNDEWVKVYDSYTDGKIWLHEVLEDNNIPYKNQAINFGIQDPRLPESTMGIHIYVPKEFKKQVSEYIKEYNSQSSSIDGTENKNELDKEDSIGKTVSIHERIMWVSAMLLMGIITFIAIMTILC